MTHNVPPGGSAQPYGRAVQGWPSLAGSGNVPPALDLTFDSESLQMLRTKVRACAIHAGFSEDRAADVVLAVHELAANAVRHGGGAGRLRVWKLARALQCQVDDGDLAWSLEKEAHRSSGRKTPPRGASGPVSMNPLPVELGHGLSVVQQLADEMQSLSGPDGTIVMITFDLSR